MKYYVWWRQAPWDDAEMENDFCSQDAAVQFINEMLVKHPEAKFYLFHGMMVELEPATRVASLKVKKG